MGHPIRLGTEFANLTVPGKSKSDGLTRSHEVTKAHEEKN